MSNLIIKISSRLLKETSSLTIQGENNESEDSQLDLGVLNAMFKQLPQWHRNLKSGKFTPDDMFDKDLEGRTFLVIDGEIFDTDSNNSHYGIVIRHVGVQRALRDKLEDVDGELRRDMDPLSLRSKIHLMSGVYDGRWALVDDIAYISFWNKPGLDTVRLVVDHYGLEQFHPVCSGLDSFKTTPKKAGDGTERARRPMKRSAWTNPGQKLWAMNSEELSVKLDRVLGGRTKLVRINE